MNIPLVDLSSQQAEVNDEVFSGLADVFATTGFVGGKAVTDFENAYADLCDVAHCIGVANGTDALELALRAAGVEQGGEVILPANSFIATAEAVVRLGAVPVLVDADDDDLLIDPGAVAASLSPRTQAVIPVHLFGQMAPMEIIHEVLDGSGIFVIEDAAQSQGATRNGRRSGAYSLAAGTSFYPGKNLGAAGDAGAVTTDDPEVAHRVRLLGAHGSQERYVHEIVGCNSRLDSVQAVVLLAKLRRLAVWNEARRAAAGRYQEMLKDVEGVRLPGTAAGNEHVWHLFVVRVAQRDRVLAELHAAGVGAAIHYPTPIHLTGAFNHLNLGAGTFSVAERAAGEIISLPIYPHITESQQDYVVRTLIQALGRR